MRALRAAFAPRAADEAVETVVGFFAALRERRPGDAVVIGAVRDGERRDLRVILAARPNE
jgi:S1-C subfamily serine protease